MLRVMKVASVIDVDQTSGVTAPHLREEDGQGQKMDAVPQGAVRVQRLGAPKPSVAKCTLLLAQSVPPPHRALSSFHPGLCSGWPGTISGEPAQQPWGERPLIPAPFYRNRGKKLGNLHKVTQLVNSWLAQTWTRSPKRQHHR